MVTCQFSGENKGICLKFQGYNLINPYRFQIPWSCPKILSNGWRLSSFYHQLKTSRLLLNTTRRRFQISRSNSCYCIVYDHESIKGTLFIDWKSHSRVRFRGSDTGTDDSLDHFDFGTIINKLPNLVELSVTYGLVISVITRTSPYFRKWMPLDNRIANINLHFLNCKFGACVPCLLWMTQAVRAEY